MAGQEANVVRKVAVDPLTAEEPEASPQLQGGHCIHDPVGEELSRVQLEPFRFFNRHVRLKVRDGLRTRWHAGTAHLLPDDNPSERQRWLASHLPSSAGNARAVRLFGTELLSIRIELDR